MRQLKSIQVAGDSLSEATGFLNGLLEKNKIVDLICIESLPKARGVYYLRAWYWVN